MRDPFRLRPLIRISTGMVVVHDRVVHILLHKHPPSETQNRQAIRHQ